MSLARNCPNREDKGADQPNFREHCDAPHSPRQCSNRGRIAVSSKLRRFRGKSRSPGAFARSKHAPTAQSRRDLVTAASLQAAATGVSHWGHDCAPSCVAGHRGQVSRHCGPCLSPPNACQLARCHAILRCHVNRAARVQVDGAHLRCIQLATARGGPRLRYRPVWRARGVWG